MSFATPSWKTGNGAVSQPSHPLNAGRNLRDSSVSAPQIKCGRRRDWIRVRSAVGSSSALSSALQGEFKDVIHTGVHSTNVDVHSIPDLQRNEFLPFL